MAKASLETVKVSRFVSPEGWWKLAGGTTPGIPHNKRAPRQGCWKNRPMSSTHCALHYHFVFGTKKLDAAIHKEWRQRLHSYLGGTIKSANGIPIAIGGVADHVHLLVGLRPTHQVSELLRDIKRQSSAWVHQEICDRRFQWQDGYGAFTVSTSGIRATCAYIESQEEHHRTKTFQEEYVAFLKKNGVEYDPQYLW